MQFKLIVAMVDDDHLAATLKAAGEGGPPGATLGAGGGGGGLTPKRSFLGGNLPRHRDILLFVVEEHLARSILERIAEVAGFDREPGTGIAVQIAIEDAVGLGTQMKELQQRIEDQI